MLTTGNTPLVAGGRHEVDMDMLTVRVVRGFYDHRKQIVEPGAIVQLPRLLALEACAARKAELYRGPASPTEQFAPVSLGDASIPATDTVKLKGGRRGE